MTRHPLNPILSANDIPYDASLVFNAGVCKWQGKYILLFRNDHGVKEPEFRAIRARGEWPHFSTNIGIATSDDGVHWVAGPKPVYSRYGRPEQFDIWLSESPDLRFWGSSRLVLGAEQVPFATGKIGPAAPPVRTPKGWLTTFHAVRYANSDLSSWEDGWRKEYLAGLMLLDLNDPAKVIGISREPR